MEIESNMAKGKEKTIYVLEYCPSEGSDPLKEWNVTQRHEHPALAPHSGGKQKVSTAAGDVELRVPPLAERNYKILGWASQRIEQLHRHLVVVHDPTSTIGPRYNLAQGIDNVSDARAIADVLVPSAQGDNKFWTDSAAALLAACLIRFPNLGEIYNAMNDLKALATALTGWASTDVRDNTAASDFDAELIVEQPTVVVLTCPGRMRAVYASYLGATLRKVMLDLNTIGDSGRTRTCNQLIKRF